MGSSGLSSRVSSPLLLPLSSLLALVSLSLGACAELDPAASPSSDEELATTVEAIKLDPSTYHCVPLPESARLVVPPPPPPPVPKPIVQIAVSDACPAGQVPVYHYAADAPKLPAVPPRSQLSTQAGTYWYASVMQPTSATARSGVGGRIFFSNPAVYDQYDMVTAEMSIVLGANYHLVEVGLRKFWDAFPRLMISQWAYGTFNDAAGFVTVHPTYAPGMPLTSYYGQAVQHYVRYDAGNWWVWFNDAWVGYFPGTIWSGGFTYGDVAHFYGEVFSAANRVPPRTDMGNGLFSSSASSAYMQDICVHAATPNCYYLSGASTYVSNSAYYSLTFNGSSFMRFGGNGGG